LDLNNFETAAAISSGLGDPCIRRLRKTWKYIPDERVAKLESFVRLFNPPIEIGKRLRQAQAPSIPFISVYQTLFS
jgi:hypothetical protein